MMKAGAILGGSNMIKICIELHYVGEFNPNGDISKKKKSAHRNPLTRAFYSLFGFGRVHQE